MYEMHIKGLSKSTFLHHKCHNKMCVNPYHLVETTTNEHQKYHQKELEVCKHGHPRTANNIYITKDGHWQCMACKNIREKGYSKLKAKQRHNLRLEIVIGVREDYGKMPIKEIAKKYEISWSSVYRYIDSTPSKLGYF